LALFVLALHFGLQPLVFAQTGATTTWAGGNSFLSWAQATNWDPQIVPLNNPGTNFTVIVPDAASLTYDASAAGLIDALSFGTGSQLLLTNGHSLGVVGVAILNGQIDARGAGSAFQAPANTIVLSGYPRFLARDGAQVGIGASSYSWANYGTNATLLSAIGSGSLVDLSQVSALQLSAGSSGAWVYAITAQSNGVVDLSSLGNLTGPGSDDLLELNVGSGGRIKLDNVRQVTSGTRLNIGAPGFELPAATLFANSTINVATGSVFRLPQAAAITNSSINVAPDGMFDAPQLNSLDGVPLTLAGNGMFLATNLVSYRNSDIPIFPGRDFRAGLLSDIYGSRIWVSGGTNFRVGAVYYEMPPSAGYNANPPKTLFSADGAGSLLDLAALKWLAVYGVYSWWEPSYGTRYDFTYSIRATNQGVIDLSRLETVYGAVTNYYVGENYVGGDDLLVFQVQSGGNILLPALKQVTQRTRFDLEVPWFEMPSLQKVDNTAFNLSNGTRLDLPSLQRFDSSRIDFGFNSSFSAPQLVNFVNSDLNLAPGKIFYAPGITNLDGSRISVGNGITWNCTAESYATPTNWNASPTLLLADGMGSLLNLASLKSLKVYGGSNGNYTNSIAANNNGAIDLSALQTIAGPDPFSNGGDDWLTLSVQSGGNIRLGGLQQATGHTRFALGDSGSLDFTNLTRLADGCTIGFGPNSVFNAPRLTEFVNSDLSLSAGSTFIAPAFTNIYASRLAVSGGRTLHVTAQNYEMPPSGVNAIPPKTLFSADGAGSLLDLAALKWLAVYGAYGWWDPSYGMRYATTYSITATNQGVIDLSGLETVYGAVTNSYVGEIYVGGDDWLSLGAFSGGTIKAGNVSVLRRAGFSASGLGSALEFGGLYLRAPATLSVGAGTQLRIRGSFIFDNTDTNSIVTEFARFQMDGITPQRLEVGGQDLGPMTPEYRRNFGYSQLMVGATNQASLVQLVDTVNNGGRGPSGAPEALYLYGLEGQGLRLLSGSRLVLGGLNCYAAVNGQMVNLKTLVNANTNTVPFDGGFLANMGGPRITGMTPSITVTPPVSFVDVAFDMAINPATFGTNDVGILGPGGPIAPLGVTLVSNNTYRIAFAAQTANGIYTVRVGPNIDELAGLFHGLDQNGNGLAGEPNDVFSGSFQLDGMPPLVVRALTLQYGTRVGITFSKPVSPTFAINPANYSVNGLTPSRAVARWTGAILREVFQDIQGNSISNLTSAASYPGSPSLTNLVTDYFESPLNFGDNYGQRMHGYIVPPVTGDYTFWIASDEGSALYLSSNDNPTNQTLIAYAASATGWRYWTSQASQRSATVALQAGRPYYICALQKEGNGEDYVAVRWLRPDGVDEGPIPATYLLPYGEVFAPARVALEVPALLGDTFTLNVTNLSDPLGNTTNVGFNGTLLPMTMRDIGNPSETGATLTFDGVDFDMTAGGVNSGSSYWNASDAGQFAFENRTGDFDVQTQVARLDQNAYYSYAGIMWRESTDPGSRRILVGLNAPTPTGFNQYWAYVRSSAGSGGSEFASTRPTVTAFPNAWLRLKRTGNVFIAYSGSNGTNWTEYGRITTDFPATGILGLTGDSRNNNSGIPMFTAFKNYGDITPAILSQPQSQTVASGSNVVFGLVARGLPELAYQWFHNGLALTDATNSLLTLMTVNTNAVGDYAAVVRNAYGAITSQVATLVVDGVGAGGFEGDVSPAPYGNNAATVSDWVKVGRLVAGLDAPLNGSEFMRADCAPRTNEIDGTLPLGNGRLTVADWTQAGRYAAGLDPLTPAGGPNAAMTAGFANLNYPGAPLAARWLDGPVLIGRCVWVGSGKAVPGQSVTVPVNLQAQGDENALGFTLSFDPTQLAYQDAFLADGLTGVTLQVNAQQEGQGRLGMVLGRSAGQSFVAGAAVLVQARFTVLGKPGAATAVGFGDAPVLREVVNAKADPLGADYQSGAVRIVQAGRLMARVPSSNGPLELTLAGQPGETYRVEVSSDLLHWNLLILQAVGSEPVSVVDPAAPLFRQRFYRAVLP
jgi:hypothetical protein